MYKETGTDFDKESTCSILQGEKDSVLRTLPSDLVKLVLDYDNSISSGVERCVTTLQMECGLSLARRGFQSIQDRSVSHMLDSSTVGKLLHRIPRLFWKSPNWNSLYFLSRDVFGGDINGERIPIIPSDSVGRGENEFLIAAILLGFEFSFAALEDQGVKIRMDEKPDEEFIENLLNVQNLKRRRV